MATENTLQPLNMLLDSLEAAISDRELRRELTSVFSQGFDLATFLDANARSPLFANSVNVIVVSMLENKLASMKTASNAERSSIIINIAYYKSLEARIESKRKDDPDSEELVQLKKELARRPKILEKLASQLSKINYREQAEASSMQKKLDEHCFDEGDYQQAYQELRQNLWPKINHMNMKEDAEEAARRKELGRRASFWPRRLIYAASALIVAAAIFIGYRATNLAVDDAETRAPSEAVRPAEMAAAPNTDNIETVAEEPCVETVVEERIPTRYTVIGEYKPGDIIEGKVGKKMIVYQGIIEQDGKKFLQFRNDEIADQATHNHPIDETILADGFDDQPDCRPFLNRWIFDIDVKTKRIRLLRDLDPGESSPFEPYGIPYNPHVNIPITELAVLRPELGIPNKYLIHEDKLDPGKRYVEIIWLRKTSANIHMDANVDGYLSDAVLSTQINMTSTEFDCRPDCVIIERLGSPRFYIDVNQHGNIQFLKQVR